MGPPSQNSAELLTRLLDAEVALDDLIAVKAHVGRPKDKLVEAELRAIRDRLRTP